MMSASGQFPDLDALKREVRFAAVNGHRQLDKLFPQRARSGSLACHDPAAEACEFGEVPQACE
jgi:hypothetical protein